MSVETRRVCDLCGMEIPNVYDYGYIVKNGVEYLNVTVMQKTTEGLPKPHKENEPQKCLDVCCWCQESIVRMAKRRRKLDLLRGGK